LNCDELEPVLTPYIDGEAPPGDRERVAEHLQRCRPCATRAAGEQAASRLVHLRARSLAPAAPRALRERCAALVRRPAPLGLTWFSWQPVRLAAATSIVLLLAGFAGFALFGHSNTLLVAGLTLDHVKCFAFSGGAPSAEADPRAVEAGLRQDYGWRLRVPPGATREGLRLVGARRCLSSDGTVAHLLYRHAGKPVSLFVLPESVRKTVSTSFIGYPSRVWSRGATTFVLVGSESDAVMQPVARYFQAAAY